MNQIAMMMQIDRRHDEVAFCHAMNAEELKVHLERPIVPGDCPLCEWFEKRNNNQGSEE